MRMPCRICQKIKKLSAVQWLMIALVCLGMYVANYFEMKEYRAKKAAALHKETQEQEKRLIEFENLQRKCYLGADAQACRELKKF